MQTLGKTLGAVMFGALLTWSVAGVGCFSSEPEKKEAKAFGQTCAADADCASTQCAGHGKVCTKTCAHDKECGESLVCRGLDSGSGMQCGKPEGSKVGSSCQTAAECDHGLCVKKAEAPGEPGFCSRTCQGSGECPDGFKICDSLTDGANKMCLLGDDKIPIDQRPKYVAPTQVVGTTTKSPTSSSSSTSSSSASSSSSSGSSSSSSSSSSASSSSSSSASSSSGNSRPQVDLGGGKSPPIIKFPPKKK